MFCTNCGKEIEPEDSKCPECGFDLSAIIALMNEPDDDDYDDIEDEIRQPEEIARRALTLAAVVSCAFGTPKPDVGAWLKSENLWDELSPEEKAYMEGNGSEKQDVQFSWRIEALVPLLWAINKIDTLPGLDSECDTEPLKAAVVWPPDSTKEYISSATIRGEDEISTEYEKVYDAHWEVRDAQLNDKDVPEQFNAGVVQERHHGFNWVIGYMQQDWDDITTDT
jgi:hypothetical protein